MRRLGRARVLLLVALALVITAGLSILATAAPPLPPVHCETDSDCQPPHSYVCCNGDCKPAYQCNQQ